MLVCSVIVRGGSNVGAGWLEPPLPHGSNGANPKPPPPPPQEFSTMNEEEEEEKKEKEEKEKREEEEGKISPPRLRF